MKITIDTQVDTYEDIKKILNILNGIIEKKDFSEPISNSTPEQKDNAETGFMNMFGDNLNSKPDTIQSKSESAPNFGSFLNLLNKPEKKEINENKFELEYY